MITSRLRAQRSNESPSGAFKRPNGLAAARWRGLAPTSSRLWSEAEHESPSGRQLLCVLRLLFTRLYGLDPQGKVQQMTDPHHGDADPADGRIFHAKKADGHNSSDHCDDLAFGSGCHGFFLNEAVQMLFV